MATRVNILVIDDGELEDVRNILEQLGAPVTHWRPKSLNGERPEIGQLLVCSAGVGSTLRALRSPDRGSSWIAVADTQATKSSLVVLQRAGFQYLVRRPIHPAALRLLLRSALFSGDEQRRKPRRVAGVPVTYRSGLRRRSATLLDLSPTGCRLLTAEALETGAQFTLQFPADLTGQDLELAAVAIRSSPEKTDAARGEFGVGVRFGRLNRATRRLLGNAWKALELGPLPLPDGAGRTGGVDLRTSPRGVFEYPVVVVSRDETRMLMARDLSSGGIRIQPDPFLSVLDRVRLAIDTDNGSFTAEATVVRDDGEHGLALRFDRLQGPGRESLREIVALLPSVESLRRAPLEQLRELGAKVLSRFRGE